MKLSLLLFAVLGIFIYPGCDSDAQTLTTNSNQPASPQGAIAQAKVPVTVIPSLAHNEDYNQIILDIILHMPPGGGYSVKKIALDNLRASVTFKLISSTPKLDIVPVNAEPSFCSGATYLVFLELVQHLLDEKKLLLSANDVQSLLIKGQSDGEGVWGRWNANGPGTARLFYELGMGKSFQSLTSAKPGDFVKLFWTDQIGAKEFGHSVIFLGTRATPQGGVIRIWSSNLNVGYSEKEVPLGKIKRMLFSRVLNPSALQFVSRLPKRDAYLASMLSNASTQEEMSDMVGDKH